MTSMLPASNPRSSADNGKESLIIARAANFIERRKYL
jgi:hypothetical protein